MAKERLDVIMTSKGLTDSRERAKRLIMAGKVLVDEKKIEKAGTPVEESAEIRIIGGDIPYVSRGGLKLAKALRDFSIDLNEKIAADVGASTGGFTDCMLQNGAKKVYAIDVGYGQLAWKLRTDPRVVNMERTNIRNVTPDMIGEAVHFASADVAFISLTKVLPTIKSFLAENAEAVALIKPQFEAGREKVGKKGVVKDAAVHLEVIERITDFCRNENLTPKNLTFSPIKGPEGNIEYLLHIVCGEKNDCGMASWLPAEIVAAAHEYFETG